jgi:hypothetical protein
MSEQYSTLILASIIGVIAFFLKTTLKRIEDNLIDHVKNFNNLSDRVNLINLSMVKIDSSLMNIDKDLERANRRVSDINQIVMNNVDKVIEQGHEINNIKAQLKMLAKEFEDK